MELLTKKIEDFLEDKRNYCVSKEKVSGVSDTKKIKRILSFFELTPKFNHCVIFLEDTRVPIGAIDRKTVYKSLAKSPNDEIKILLKNKSGMFEGILNCNDEKALNSYNIFYKSKTILDVIEALTSNRVNGELLDYILVVDEKTKEIITFMTYKDVLKLLRENIGEEFKNIRISDIDFSKIGIEIKNPLTENNHVDDRPRDPKHNVHYRSHPVISTSGDFLGFLFDASITSLDYDDLLCSDSRVLTHFGRFSNSALVVEDTLDKAINGYIENPLHSSLPIMTKNKSSKLHGVISYTDVFRYFVSKSKETETSNNV